MRRHKDGIGFKELWETIKREPWLWIPVIFFGFVLPIGGAIWFVMTNEPVVIQCSQS